jgi:hypothetical protein
LKSVIGALPFGVGVVGDRPFVNCSDSQYFRFKRWLRALDLEAIPS